MKKSFVGSSQTEVRKKAKEWVDAQGDKIRQIGATQMVVRTLHRKTFAPKNEGEWTVTILYEKAN